MDLLGRVRAATGPDRELDFQIVCAVRGHDYLGLRDPRFVSMGYRMRREAGGPILFSSTIAKDELAVTASLDAALALVERVAMPEPDFDICFRQLGRFGVRWFVPALGHWRVTEAATPALALLAALLTALLAQDPQP